MGVCGNYVKTFADSNIACAVDVSMDCPPPHCFFEIVKVEGNKVTLKSNSSTTFELDIKKDSFSEYVVIPQKTMYEEVFRKPPRNIKVLPMKGERF